MRPHPWSLPAEGADAAGAPPAAADVAQARARVLGFLSQARTPRAFCAARQGIRALDSRLRSMPALLPASAARLSPLLPKPACLLAYAAHAALLCRFWAEMTWRLSTCCCSFWAGTL